MPQSSSSPKHPPSDDHRGEELDQTTTISELKRLMHDFVDERQWWKYHTPKNLASSITIESAELLEHFQWTTPEETLDAATKEKVADEISDVLAYIMSLSNVLDIDLSTAFRRKMRKNARKYPAENFRGTWEKVHDSSHYLKRNPGKGTTDKHG